MESEQWLIKPSTNSFQEGTLIYNFCAYGHEISCPAAVPHKMKMEQINENIQL